MTRSVTIRWRPGVFRTLRTLPGVMTEIDRRAARVAGAAGPGYEASTAEVTGGRGRGRASVRTATFDAMRREPRQHNLLRGLNAGRG